jgi:hypothetical protein
MDLVPGPEGQLIKIWIRNSDENSWIPVRYEYGHKKIAEKLPLLYFLN